jgi:predicted negative regulator of RcsB-dependent stress response
MKILNVSQNGGAFVIVGIIIGVLVFINWPAIDKYIHSSRSVESVNQKQNDRSEAKEKSSDDDNAKNSSDTENNFDEFKGGSKNKSDSFGEFK